MTLKRFALIPLVLAILWSAGCASLDSTVPEGDLDLAAAAQHRLVEDSVTSRLALGVSVNQGVATLNGSVRDAGAKARALAILRGTPGIKGVVDNTTR